MDINSKYLQIVNNLPIVFKIKKVAPAIFEVFKEYVEKEYPDYCFNAENKLLTENIEKQFAASLESLFKKEKNGKNKLPGF